MSDARDGGKGGDYRLPAELSRALEINARLGTALLQAIRDEPNPDRDWCRAYGHYRGQLQALLAEERERAKLQMLAARRQILTDEEYAQELALFSGEAVEQLSDGELEAELQRRGVTP